MVRLGPYICLREINPPVLLDISPSSLQIDGFPLVFPIIPIVFDCYFPFNYMCIHSNYMMITMH